MKKLIAFIIAALVISITMAASATAIPWYSTRCSGCASTVYTHTPYTHHYYGSYSYGYDGWDNYNVHYHSSYRHFRNYYPKYRNYPYAYNFYPSPMYGGGYGGYGGYGPGIIW